MKKQLIGAVLCGTVLPLLAGIALGRLVPEPAALTAAQPEPEPAEAAYDSVTPVTVQMPSGESVRMELGEYLTGVVLAEMPADFAPEALKAQAVVARTYTCRRLKAGKHDAAAVCTDPGCCQGYCSGADFLDRGGTEKALQKVRQAVFDTDGRVLTYAGELIDATYFSCSGGFTEDAVAVWGRDVPYLQAVESPGEEDAPRFSDRVSFSAQELQERLGVSADGPVSEWFGPMTGTAGGGVDTVRICGREFTGKELRSLLGLRSTAFTVEFGENTAIFETRGFGHRVGMSQYGAQAMALEGRSCEEILGHYYQQTELSRMEP